MPKIIYKAKRFNAFPPTQKLARGTAGVDTNGELDVSIGDLGAHAAAVGDTALFSGAYSRPAMEIVWRKALILSSLSETSDKHFCRSASYMRLDPSEKSAVSYFTGMVQCSLMADRLLGVTATVHVDALLKLLGKRLPNRSRPDLVGFNTPPTATNTPARFLLEAKGRTNAFSNAPVSKALLQLRSPIASVQALVSANPLYAASLSYFEPTVKNGAPKWHSYLEDPPPPSNSISSELTDTEFSGLIILAQLLPIHEAVKSADGVPDGDSAERRDFTMAQLPLSDSFVGLPTSLHKLLATIEGPLRDSDNRRSVALAAWELAQDLPEREAVPLDVEHPEKLGMLASGTTYYGPSDELGE